jgi:hypothetical protein
MKKLKFCTRRVVEELNVHEENVNVVGVRFVGVEQAARLAARGGAAAVTSLWFFGEKSCSIVLSQ